MIGFVAVLHGKQQEILPIGADGVAIRPTRAARLERAVAPTQDLERGGFTDATPADGVHDLPTAKEQVSNVRARADANHALAPRQAFHLHEIGQARPV
jgi:hypothetical protein